MVVLGFFPPATILDVFFFDATLFVRSFGTFGVPVLLVVPVVCLRPPEEIFFTVFWNLSSLGIINMYL